MIPWEGNRKGLPLQAVAPVLIIPYHLGNRLRSGQPQGIAPTALVRVYVP